MTHHEPTTAPDTPSSHEARFDQAARTLHADALTGVSPQVRSRLQQARQTATMARATKRSPIWAWAGSTAVLALALGAGIQLQRAPVSTPAHSGSMTAVSSVPSDHALATFDEGDVEVTELLAALDEDPDFYLWLAANDGALPTPTERYQ